MNTQIDKYSKRELLRYARFLEFALFYARNKKISEQTTRIVLSKQTPLDFKMNLIETNVNDCLKNSCISQSYF